MIPIYSQEKAWQGRLLAILLPPVHHTRHPEMLFVTHAVLTSKQQAVIKLTSETLQQQKNIWFDAVSPHQCWTPASKTHYKKHEFFKEP